MGLGGCRGDGEAAEGTGAVGPWRFPGGCAGVKPRNPAAFLSPAACLEAGLAMGLWVGGRQRGGPPARLARCWSQPGWGDGCLHPAWPMGSSGCSRPLHREAAPGPIPAAGAISRPGPWLTSERGITRMFRGETGIGGTQGFARLSQIKFRRCSERGARARGDSGASESSLPACFALSSPACKRVTAVSGLALPLPL